MTLGTCSPKGMEGLLWRNWMNLVQKQCNDSCYPYVSSVKNFSPSLLRGKIGDEGAQMRGSHALPRI